MFSRPATRILRSGWYPGIVQMPVLILFAVVIAYLWLGPVEDERNLGTILVWYLWWPFLWFSFLFFGRLWCGLCPLPPLMRLAQRLRAPKAGIPEWLKSRRLFLLFGSFLLLHLVNLRVDFEENVGGTLALVLAVTGAALATALLLRRRAWCGYLCPMGALAGMMSMNSVLRLELDAECCRDYCRDKPCRGGRGLELPCPLVEGSEEPVHPRDCDFCGHCVKVCPADALEVRLNPPAWFLWSRARSSSAEGALVLLLFGIVLGMGMKHMIDWPLMLWRLSGALSISVDAWGEAGLLLLIAVSPLLLFSLCLVISAGKDPSARPVLFRHFSRGIYPLALAGMIAVNLKRIVIAGPMGLKSFLFGHGVRWGWLNAVQALDGMPLMAASMGVFLVGIGGCLAVWHKTRRDPRLSGMTGGGRMWPGLAFAGVAGTSFLWVLSHPMIT